MVLWVEEANQRFPPVSVKLYNPSECGPVKSLLAACKTFPVVVIIVIVIQSQISPELDCRLRVLLVSSSLQSSPVQS